MAVLDACRQLVHRLQPLREKLGPDASLAQLATAAWFSRVDLCAHGYFSLDGRRCGFDFNVKPGVKPDGTPDQTTRGNLHNYYTQGVGCVEVEIDVLTGDHEVLRADMLVDLGSSINPALDVGQIEGGFTQGMGWTTMEELVWGDEQHEWVQPGGRLHTAGPGTYKIPAFNDTPRQLNVQLMSGVDNKVAIHSSKAVGEPPFFIGAVVFIAIRNAVAAARKDHLTADGGEGGAGDAESDALPHVSLYSPATSERIRMACGDRFAARAIGDEEANRKDALIVKGSF